MERGTRGGGGDGRPLLTPDTYPSPSDQEKCGSNYLKLNFVCDPESLLSHTEAVIINRTLGRKFYHCFGSVDELASVFSAGANGGNDEEIYDPAAGGGGNKATVVGEEARRNDVRDYFNRNTDGGHHRHTHKCIQKRFYTVGIALAKTMQDDSFGPCNGPPPPRTYDLDQHRVLKSLFDRAKVMPRMARKLRLNNWSNKGRGCSTDILVLIVQNVAFCHEGSRAIFHGGEPFMGLSFSPRVQKLFSESAATNLEQSRRKWKFDPSGSSSILDSLQGDQASTILRHYNNKLPPSTNSGINNCQNRNCVINMIKRMMQLLDDGLPDPPAAHSETEEEEPSEDESSAGQHHEHERAAAAGSSGGHPKPTLMPWFPSPKHTIPHWAMIAFAVSLTVALGCAYLGHWVNTGRSRLHATSDSSAKYQHAHNRRWRAGFGGGMLEMHNHPTKPGGGAPASGGFGQAPARGRIGPPGTGGAVRAKMFGGLGGLGPAAGARSRQANGPQQGYHRV